MIVRLVGCCQGPMHTSCMSLDVGHGSVKENVLRYLQPQGGCGIMNPYCVPVASIPSPS